MNRLRFLGLGATILSTFSVAGCTAVLGIASDAQTLAKECTTNQQCIASKGANFICKKTDNTCQSLTNDDCKEVLGGDNLKDDDTLLFGALFAINGSNASIGAGEDAALHMAFNDFTQTGALPPAVAGGKPRNLAVLVCDDSATNDVALRSVSHMIDDLQIPAIVGPSWSGPTINFLTNKSIQAGMLAIGAGTTSPDLTGLAKNGLYYRTCESTALEVPPIAKLANDMQAQITIGDPTLAGQVKVFVGYKGDSFGKGTHDALAKLPFNVNGKPSTDPTQTNYKEEDYGNPAAPTQDPLKYDDTVANIIAFKPNIVILIGTSEAQANIMAPAEKQWPAGVRRPYWVYTHSQVSGAMVTSIQNTDTTGDLRKRVLGVTFGTSTSPAYTRFRTNFSGSQAANISPDSIFANTTYDAFYTLIYAAIAAGNKPLTGANISAGIGSLVPQAGTTAIDVGSGDLTKALGILSTGGRIDINGTSGPLDFNLTTGDVAQENQVWCLPDAGNNQPGFPTFSGYFFDLNGNPTQTLTAVTAKCGVQFTKP